MSPQQVRCADIRRDPRSGGYPPLAVEVLANDIRAHGNGIALPIAVRMVAARKPL